MSIISTVKSWPVSVALVSGIAIGSAGTYKMTADKYSESAIVQTATDTLVQAYENPVYEDVQVITGKDTTTEKVVVNYITVPKAVTRPLLRYAWSGVKKGDKLRAVLFVNDVITSELVRDVTESPLPPNDGFSAVIKLDVREDRIAALPAAKEPAEPIGEVGK